HARGICLAREGSKFEPIFLQKFELNLKFFKYRSCCPHYPLQLLQMFKCQKLNSKSDKKGLKFCGTPDIAEKELSPKLLNFELKFESLLLKI
ncbi:hypothetical protein, partial [Klebsiella pneumoniae]|uniref:hypothetical protein n=1 Tax=Klebsiella pneumoniae TaxID=573 RepID=UPI0039C2C61B